ncbi:MAG: c-type cytochrome [Hyphomicrobiales bacterium]|nr:c-type cytochrome [Hyphomicrobiales bacterium]
MAVFLAAGVLTSLLTTSAAVLGHRDDLSAADRERVSTITAPADNFAHAEPRERSAAGAATTIARPNHNAFSFPAGNLSFDGQERFKTGNELFRKAWLAAPASEQASDGLGPLFNAPACELCHVRDGRGRPPPSADEPATTMFLRLSVPPSTDAERTALAEKTMLRIPEPTYGGQLQNFSVPGVVAEGQMRITYDEQGIELNGGEAASLRMPTYEVVDLGHGPLAPGTMVSPRVTPPMIGVGLLEAIHPGDILAEADPDDNDGDGISGKVSWVRDPVTGDLALGRFGWKASTPTIAAQTADAFSGDIGISTPPVPAPYGDCTAAQTVCRAAPHGVQDNLGPVEAPDPVLELVTLYSRNVGVPPRRDIDDPDVLRGKKLFYSFGCVGCHTPKYVTSRSAPQPEYRFQLIWPYTDLLLHDMGEGLADHRPVGDASGSEWRTPPLWGIGLTETVNGHTFFLHDGRARNLLEAVLWHGGEAEMARDAVVAATPDERAALIRFLKSL